MITVVSGLPRAGTSMMMQMLEAGGVEVLVDEVRRADVDNPRGYYEYQKVKQTRRDVSWLDDAEAKAIKMVYALLYDLPKSRRYKVIVMTRNMEEILASQRQMLARMGKEIKAGSDLRLAEVLEGQTRKVKDWLVAQRNMDLLNISYNDVLAHPEENARKVNAFLGGRLAVKKMVEAVDRTLYRQRR